MSAAIQPNFGARQILRVFLCGGVMTGRGIDQIMPHPCDPQLYEDWVQSASDYVRLAERVNGKIPTHVAPTYVWGAALDQLNRVRPDASIINLETSITHSDAYIPKGMSWPQSSPRAPAVLPIQGKGRVIVFSFASTASGVQSNLAATPKTAGVNLLPDFTDETIRSLPTKSRVCTGQAI